LEGELKKEIKKLQRFRDQIKTWCASNEIKDKKNLMENRKLIETQMERFKAMERELKTKAYSQAGLAASKMDPEEKEKEEIRSWITEMGEKLTTQLDMLEVELESLKVGSKKKRQDKNDRSSKISHQIERHKFHQTSLEIILRMLDNGDLKPDDVFYFNH
jgi:CCR4-NOT transcription complex subunit 3